MRIAVIGGGAAGLAAAGSARGADVVIFDHSDKVGRKIYITGKGRCNFTNVCDNNEFLSNVVRNAPFLRSALARFGPYDAISLLEELGCRTKIERGRRAFPLSDKASDVTKALKAYAENNGAEIRTGVHVSDIRKVNDVFEVACGKVCETFDRVIVCTGGKSYPSTGSDGSGYALAKRLGHTVVPPLPSLVALKCSAPMPDAEGLTLKNVSLRADGIKPIFGDLMITDSGISGPIALTLSALAARREQPYAAYLDLKPAMNDDELDARILRDFSERLNRQFKNALDGLLPKAMIAYVTDKSGISPDKQVNAVTKAERRALVGAIKAFPLEIVANDGFDRAVITSGGVDVSEVEPKTMMSKLVGGLYFGGEVLDVDALTGGYNFHIALATGIAAGASAGGQA